MPSGPGLELQPYVLAEAIRAGHGPGGDRPAEPDGIVALGAIVARELYGTRVPVVVLDPEAYDSIADGMALTWRPG